MVEYEKENNWVDVVLLTATTESRAATAKISAQETTPGHTFSTFVLMVSITLKPLNEFAFGPAVFSPVKLDVSSKRTEASHPCQQKKEILYEIMN